MVGAGVIAAVANALGRRPFPFVFGGDGASFAVSAPTRCRGGLAGARRDGRLRPAPSSSSTCGSPMIPVGEIRAAGRDVRVARFAASEHCVYAMFTGGGLTWFEEQAKRGDYALAPAPPGARPDLSGLSCRWGVAPAQARRSCSRVIVAPRGDDPRYPALVDEVVAHGAGGSAEAGGRSRSRASGVAAPGAGDRARGLAPTRPPARPRVRRDSAPRRAIAIGATFHKFKLKAGGFDAALYAADVAANADFRKFDDGLRMTLDCSRRLRRRARGAARPPPTISPTGASTARRRRRSPASSPRSPSAATVHFVDGADGGYTMAATRDEGAAAPETAKAA